MYCMCATYKFACVGACVCVGLYQMYMHTQGTVCMHLRVVFIVEQGLDGKTLGS